MKQPNPKFERAVQIPSEGKILQGDLTVPDAAGGIILFAHGSGSSRHSPRNRYVAEVLQHSGLATLLMDLLTPEEEELDSQTAALRFDIELLAGRLVDATWWVLDQSQTASLRIGYFGASTGAAAALVAAAELPDLIDAVVSRGGRPDLAGAALRQVVAPTLLIVGGKDLTVLELNRKALDELPGEKRLEIVPDASHLFEEPGALEAVASLASKWFVRYLSRTSDQIQAA
jgi:putative phosphoribosyl transferase